MPNMKNFKVKYIVQTCGRFNYKLTDTQKAESEEEAIKIIKAEAGDKMGFKRCRVMVRSIEEVGMDIEIHK